MSRDAQLPLEPGARVPSQGRPRADLRFGDIEILAVGAIIQGWLPCRRRERSRRRFALTGRHARVRRGSMKRPFESWPMPAADVLRYKPGPPGAVILGIRRSVGDAGNPTPATDAGFLRRDGGTELLALTQRLLCGEMI